MMTTVMIMFLNNNTQLHITREHLRTREGRGRRPIGQQTLANPVQQDEKQRHISRRNRYETSSHY